MTNTLAYFGCTRRSTKLVYVVVLLRRHLRDKHSSLFLPIIRKNNGTKTLRITTLRIMALCITI